MLAQKFPVQNRIFDMFRTGGGDQNQQQQQQQTPNPGNMPNGNPQQQQNGNPNDPNQQQNQQNQQQQQQDDTNKSPLAEFSKLWDTPAPAKDGEAVPPNWDEHSSIVPKMNIDPKKLFESAKRIDFSKVMNPERVQAALKGDVGAFNEVLNSALQAAFAHSAMSTSKIVEALNGQMAEKLMTGALPHHMRKHSVNSQIDADNPIFSDPAVAPMLETAKRQFQLKNPKASPKEISDMAKKYILGFAELVTKGQSTGPSNKGGGKGGLNSKGLDGDMDWLEFAEGSGQQQ
jgi:hypothetical protein